MSSQLIWLRPPLAGAAKLCARGRLLSARPPPVPAAIEADKAMSSAGSRRGSSATARSMQSRGSSKLSQNMLGLSSRTLRELAAAREEIAQLEELADARAEILRLKERIAANIVADGDDDTVVSQMPARATNTPRKLQPMPPSAPRSTVSALSAQPPQQLACVPIRCASPRHVPPRRGVVTRQEASGRRRRLCVGEFGESHGEEQVHLGWVSGGGGGYPSTGSALPAGN